MPLRISERIYILKRMVKHSQMELENLHCAALNIMENFILIKEMAAEKWNMKMVKATRENSRTTNLKDMEHGREQMEIDISANSKTANNTVTVYTDGLTDQCIKDNTEWEIIMGKDITGRQIEINFF
jgi:hypothetical protein